MNIVLLTAMGVGGSTVAGSLIGFIFNDFTKKFSGFVMSFSAGVMLATSVFNLIIPSLDYEKKYSELIVVLGILCGSFCVGLLDFIVEKIIIITEKNRLKKIETKEKLHKILLFVAAIAIHNLPEGIAAGVGFGTGNVMDAFVIAGSIAIQNFPEGMVLISPMLSVGISRSKTLIIAIITGLIEVIGTFIGYLSVSFSKEILPFALSFAGGTMIYVICGDMIPESQNKKSVYSLMTGFCSMIILNSLF